MGSETGGIRSIFAALRAAPMPLKQVPEDVPAKRQPFVTISRQGGAGGRTVGQLLVNRLNALDPGEVPWTLWDRELVEKVAADHSITKELVESLEESGKSWLEEFLAGLSSQADQSDARIYQLVASTIRALAQKGRVVIVGRGGVYITRNMPGATHLRLIAPTDYRARHMAEQMKVSQEVALAQVHQIDNLRSAFYHRYWPIQVVVPEAFTLTINIAMVSEERAVESVIPLVLRHMRAASPERVPGPEMAAM